MWKRNKPLAEIPFFCPELPRTTTRRGRRLTTEWHDDDAALPASPPVTVQNNSCRQQKKLDRQKGKMKEKSNNNYTQMSALEKLSGLQLCAKKSLGWVNFATFVVKRITVAVCFQLAAALPKIALTDSCKLCAGYITVGEYTNNDPA